MATQTIAPAVVLVDNEKDVAKRLLAALREMEGKSVRIVVRDHHTVDDTLVVMLPEGGPSLAKALQEWVHEWWSEGDDETFGSQTAYLQGFGVSVQNGSFVSTSCPYCGTDGHLSGIRATVNVTDMPVDRYGVKWDPGTVKSVENLIIQCRACRREFPITELAL